MLTTDAQKKSLATAIRMGWKRTNQDRRGFIFMTKDNNGKPETLRISPNGRVVIRMGVV